MSRIVQPVGKVCSSRDQKYNRQIKLTNVAIVRYESGGKRFEIACYKNKVGLKLSVVIELTNRL